MTEGKQKRYSRIIPTDTLQLTRLVRRYFLGRRAFLVENVVESDTNGDGIADMRDEIRPRNSQTDGRVVNVVDEIMHIRRREIHESMHLRH